MLLRLRVRLPDRPGSLGRISRTIGAVGADILAVTVLERSAGQAVDEFSVTWPDGAALDRLTQALAAVPGVTLEGAWTSGPTLDAFPDLDVLGQIAADPARAMPTLVDAVPGVFGADWAAAFAGPPGSREVLHASRQAPAALPVPPDPPLRATAVNVGSWRLAALPIGLADSLGPMAATLLLGRGEGPGFHRVELMRLTRLVEIVRVIIAVPALS